MTNKEYLRQELPLWLFNKLVWEPHKDSFREYTSLTSVLIDLHLSVIRSNVKDTNFSLVDWNGDSAYINRYIKSRWSQNKNFLFPCTVEEALSILQIVEPEFYQFFTVRMGSVRIADSESKINKWFNHDSVFGHCIDWYSTPEGGSYWATKTDFSLSPQWIAEQTVVCKANPEPKTIGEWLDLPENALIKEIAEFDYRIHGRSLASKRTDDYIGFGHDSNVVYFSLPTSGAPFVECKNSQSFQPYIGWYNNHPKNPKNVTTIVALKDVDEEHSIEWWRDELAKTEPEVASYLYAQYGLQGRTSQNPRKLFGDDSTSFLGGFIWSFTELKDDVHSTCESQKSMQLLREALVAKNSTVKISSVVVDSVSSEMPGATFPCTIQERINWMLTQPKLKPIAEFIIRDSNCRGNRVVHGEFSNSRGDSFAYWVTSQNIIEQTCHNAKSWEPFFDKFPHLRVKTVKPVELKITREHRQLLVECANIKEVKQLLRHINQESAFTHSARLVVFYDLDERKAYHVGNTKKSQWKQIPNKVHKKVSVEYFLTEVPNLMLDLASDKKPRLGASERFQEIFGLPVVNLPISTSSWFEDVPVEPKVNTKSWFD